MKLNEITYFCDDGHENSPVCKISEEKRDLWWPITIKIGDLIIFCNEQQLIAFKNSVISEYENLRR